MKMQYLYKYDDGKWSWARKATTKFMNGFKRFDGYVEDKEQVYIGVYGPTQVGKTTFILTLLGIQFDWINELSDALRGGREKGKSATITCTIFKKSNDEQFHIIWPSGQTFACSTLNQVEQVMFDLRNKIYGENQFSLTPLVIEIPKQFFNQAEINQRVRDLSIIDLPGDDSKDHLEMHHVNRVLKEYISRCKVCIIMEIASQMTSLTKLDKEFVKDWMLLPEQFRILLTRSVTNGSVMRSILEGKVSTAEQFKGLYLSELSRVSEVDDVGTAVYPLEFGDSWMDLKQTHPELFEKTNDWIKAIFNELVDDLTQINSPEQEIKKIKSMDRLIMKKQQQEIELLQGQLKNAKQDLKEIDFTKQSLELMVDKQKVKVKQIAIDLEQVKSLEEFNRPEIYIHSWSELTFSNRKASYLQYQFSLELQELEEKAQIYVNDINSYIAKLNRKYQSKITTITFPKELFNTVMILNYKLDHYFKESTYEQDANDAKETLSNIGYGLIEYLKESLSKIEQALSKKMKSQKLIYMDYIDQIEQQSLERKMIEAQIAAVEKQIEEAKRDWQEDLKRSRQLDLFLMESFVEQSNTYKKRLVNKKTSNQEKWIIHQYWNILKWQAERIINDGNEYRSRL